MSIINKVAEEALRQNRLLAQMSNISYNAINGKRQNRREFFEGILSDWENYEPTLVNFYTIEQRFIVVNCHILKKQF